MPDLQVHLGRDPEIRLISVPEKILYSMCDATVDQQIATIVEVGVFAPKIAHLKCKNSSINKSSFTHVIVGRQPV